MKKKRIQLTQKDFDRIQDAVKQAELKSMGEIVPVIAMASDAYRWVHWGWALVGWAVSSIVLWYRSAHSPWVMTVSELVFAQSLAMGLGYLISYIPCVKRISIPKHWKAHRVHQRSLVDFVEAGLTETHGRTGVMILVSLFERRIHTSQGLV